MSESQSSGNLPIDPSNPPQPPSIPSVPPAAKPQPRQVVVPGPQDDMELDQEIEAALGDMSLIDVYGMGEVDPAAATAAVKPSGPASGVQRGKVLQVTSDGVFVDMGGKSQGMLPLEELGPDEVVKPGDTVEVAIVEYDKRDGLLILSKRAAEQRLLRSNLREGALVEARVVGSNKGGLELDIKGLAAFMPASQIDMMRIEDLNSLIGQRFTCEVTQVEHGDRNIVLSRRAVLEREAFEKRGQIWAELEQGQKRHGVVRSLMEYGAFVDIGGVDGLLHVREISWGRVNHPKDVLAVGQGIDVVVIGVDREKQRISLSLRQAGGDPWTLVEQNYLVGSRHSAVIKNLMDFGAFAELEPGVEGLIPISQMSWAGRIRHPSDVVQAGATVEVEVVSIDMAKRRISLSMKRVQANPWSGAEQRFQANQVYPGTVARLTDFGAFITLEPGVDGLRHISELSDKRVNRVSDVLSLGQQVAVRVVSVDVENRRIALSLKGTAPAAEHEVHADVHMPGAEVISETTAEPAAGKKKKKDRPLRGGLTW